MELTVLILCLNEAPNLAVLLPEVLSELSKLQITSEILIVDGGSQDATVSIAERHGCRVIVQQTSGYGSALREGFAASRGQFIVALDADCSHPAPLVSTLWKERETFDIVVGSRFVKDGSSGAPWGRRILSKVLNWSFRSLLALPVRDVSSGLRLYRTSVVRKLPIKGEGFEVLVELIVHAVSAGHSIGEIGFSYQPRRAGLSHARIIKFGLLYLRAMARLWKPRFEASSADYDNRAYNSINLVQRYWQRKRYSIITSMVGDEHFNLLDVGCGSSKIAQTFSKGVAFDYSIRKLRFLKSTNRKRILASTFDLPFADGSFNALIHSQVIEHLPENPKIFEEIERVLKPQGILILGTPDYDQVSWRIIEFIYGIVMPHAYAGEHITHYTRNKLRSILMSYGFNVLEERYILRGELIIKAMKN